MEQEASQLLCLLQLCRLDDPEMKRIEGLSKGLKSEGWTFFFELATQNSAFILTAKRLRSLGLLSGENASLAADFLKKTDAFELLASARSKHATEFLNEAHRQGIEVIVLKGGLLGSVLYGDPSYKKMNDVDVLVTREQAPLLAEMLRKMGWMSVGALFKQKEFSKASHHCPPFVSADLKCMIGIHWGLTSPYSRWKPDYVGIWQRKEPAQVFGAEAFRMSWIDNLLHLCIHLPFFKIGVRELADVYNLIRFADGSIDWAEFDLRVKTWKAEDPAWRVLSLTKKLELCEIPKEVLSLWRSGAGSFTAQDTERRLRLGSALIASRSVHIGKIEKAFAVFRITENLREKFLAWLMTWKLTFFPKSSEVPKLLGERYRTFDGRIRVIPVSWQAMARDYGNLGIVLMTIANVVILLKEVVAYPFKKAGLPIRSNPHYKILEMLE